MQQKFSILFISIIILLSSCQRKEGDFEHLKEQLVKKGYTNLRSLDEGYEKTALGFFGVDNLVAYQGEKGNFVIIQFRDADEEKIEQKMKQMIDFIEQFIAEEDRGELKNPQELIDKQSLRNKNLLLLWQDEKPDEVVKIVKNNY